MKIVAKYPETDTTWTMYELENGWIIVLGGHDTELWIRGRLIAVRVDGGWSVYRRPREVYPCRCAAVAAALMM